MSYQAYSNLIVHEIQTTEGIHLSQESRSHIERLVMEAIRKESLTLAKEKHYWMNMYLNLQSGLNTRITLDK